MVDLFIKAANRPTRRSRLCAPAADALADAGLSADAALVAAAALTAAAALRAIAALAGDWDLIGILLGRVYVYPIVDGDKKGSGRDPGPLKAEGWHIA